MKFRVCVNEPWVKNRGSFQEVIPLAQSRPEMLIFSPVSCVSCLVVLLLVVAVL